MNIHHLSASSISAFRECPMAFYGRYLYGWTWVAPAMQAQAMALGSAVHKALEAHHTGQDAITALCQHWGSIDVPMPADTFAKAIGLVRVYTADEAHDPRDICESKFVLRVPGVPVDIVGYIDLIRGLTVRELKTTGSKSWWTPERATKSLQTGLYALAVGERNCGAQVTVEHHVLSHHKDEFTHVVYTDHPNKADQQVCTDSVRETWEEISKGELVAKCAPGKCRFPTRCRSFGYVGTDSLELVVK